MVYQEPHAEDEYIYSVHTRLKTRPLIAFAFNQWEMKVEIVLILFPVHLSVSSTHQTSPDVKYYFSWTLTFPADPFSFCGAPDVSFFETLLSHTLNIYTSFAFTVREI